MRRVVSICYWELLGGRYVWLFDIFYLEYVDRYLMFYNYVVKLVGDFCCIILLYSKLLCEFLIFVCRMVLGKVVGGMEGK